MTMHEPHDARAAPATDRHMTAALQDAARPAIAQIDRGDFVVLTSESIGPVFDALDARARSGVAPPVSARRG